MKKCFRFFLMVALAGLPVAKMNAQLAITEAMSSESTKSNVTTTVPAGPDFWELSNFGATTIDLTGYIFNDADATRGGDANSSALNGVLIAPGESIILFQLSAGTRVTNRADFINWWGATNLPAGIQVLTYSGNGLSAGGDSIVLWAPTATNDNDFVDRVDFSTATAGHSFTYNPTNGVFGVISSNGVNGAFKAVTADDEGSPGTNSGPVTLTITQQPTPSAFTVPAGSDASFTAAAQGLPHPRYQWQFQSNDIPGAMQATLTLTNVQSTNQGAYRVVITNGFQTVTSSNAALTVTVGPAAPTFTVTPPARLDAFIGQTVTLTASANGSPTPTYQWKRGTTNIATGNTLTLPGVQTNQTGTYTLIASNSAGTNSVSTVLTVTTKPKLLITEIQATEASPNGAHADWWELTSLDDHPINLQGYRWDDSSESLAPNNAVAFTNDFTIYPGESIVFVEGITADAFRAWWGTNLPPGLQIITYSGNGLGLSGSGDAVNVWNAVSTTSSPLSEKVAAASFATATSGVTLVYDPENPPIGGVMSVLAADGVNGAFFSAETATNADLGSPGYVVAPMFLTASPTNTPPGSLALSWNSVSNRNYSVYYRTNLVDTNWLTLTNVTAVDTNTTVIDPNPAATRRFYRLGVFLTFPAFP